jgi:hypothetical protein
MSKGRVWNKGKRNGGGGPPGGSKSKLPTKSKDSSSYPPQPQETGSPESTGGFTDPRINTVERMNRENWVTRPDRVPGRNKNG